MLTKYSPVVFKCFFLMKRKFISPKIFRNGQKLPFIDGDENWKFWLKSDILMKVKFVGFSCKRRIFITTKFCGFSIQIMKKKITNCEYLDKKFFQWSSYSYHKNYHHAGRFPSKVPANGHFLVILIILPHIRQHLGSKC